MARRGEVEDPRVQIQVGVGEGDETVVVRVADEGGVQGLEQLPGLVHRCEETPHGPHDEGHEQGGPHALSRHVRHGDAEAPSPSMVGEEIAPDATDLTVELADLHPVAGRRLLRQEMLLDGGGQLDLRLHVPAAPIELHVPLAELGHLETLPDGPRETGTENAEKADLLGGEEVAPGREEGEEALAAHPVFHGQGQEDVGPDGLADRNGPGGGVLVDVLDLRALFAETVIAAKPVQRRVPAGADEGRRPFRRDPQGEAPALLPPDGESAHVVAEDLAQTGEEKLGVVSLFTPGCAAGMQGVEQLEAGSRQLEIPPEEMPSETEADEQTQHFTGLAVPDGSGEKEPSHDRSPALPFPCLANPLAGPAPPSRLDLDAITGEAPLSRGKLVHRLLEKAMGLRAELAEKIVPQVDRGEEGVAQGHDSRQGSSLYATGPLQNGPGEGRLVPWLAEHLQDGPGHPVALGPHESASCLER